jgi:hypothetical protein
MLDADKQADDEKLTVATSARLAEVFGSHDPELGT